MASTFLAMAAYEKPPVRIFTISLEQGVELSIPMKRLNQTKVARLYKH